MTPKYSISRVHLSLIREEQRLYCNNLCSPTEVAKMLSSLFKESDREHMVLISLSSCMEPVAYEVISTGTVDACLVDMKSIFKHILLSNANGLIMSHNHPSLSITPSTEDDQITKKIKDACKLLDINFHDHLIWASADQYYSYRENNWNNIDN